MSPSTLDSPQSWARLALALALATIGGVGMWSVVVALPAVQADFGVARGAASLPYTLTMLGFGVAGVVVGRLVDRFGILRPMLVSSALLGLGYLLSGYATTLTGFALAQGLLIGVGSSVTFGPLLAHVSMWFERRRGIAVALVASGNYLAGTIWPPVVQHFISVAGWRATYAGVGVFILATMLPLALLLRRPPPPHHDAPEGARRTAAGTPRALGLSPSALQGLLVVAGVACCVAMAMPQVHIVAYCSDLGYGPARGAQMLSLMLGFGIVSRVTFGMISDRIGGLRTLLLGGGLQCVALLLFLPFDGLVSLYVISALFGLFQGGIVPSYAIIVREYFPAREAGGRIGVVILATLVGMALGGWMSGVIFDLTGSYHAAFLHGIAWNLVNVSIASWLIFRTRARPAIA
ncbi:MAG TPA: MFS transporter [Casimicrobiaceae bacterium]|nr:MFS transporter [Casimicrobiaceae bacterium]